METQIFTYIFIAAFVLVIAYLVSLQAMFRAAEKSDMPLFLELGSPHIINNNKPGHTFRILKILLTFKYLHSSKKVILWGNVAITLFFLTLISYIGLFYALYKVTNE